MQHLQHTPSNDLTFDEIIAHLSQSGGVDGLALFGSRASPSTKPQSDYDLLILVNEPPIAIFQMLTYIDHRMADVVFVDVADVDRILEQKSPGKAGSMDNLFLQKMVSATILYDASGRLRQAQDYAQLKRDHLMLPTAEDALYGAWFWLNHGLIHMKRMIQAEDALYQTAVDLMLMGALGSICRTYFSTRSLPWEGEKAGLRYLQIHDPAYVELLRTCLAETNRHVKLAYYEKLVIRTLEPVGTLWAEGITAVWLSNVPHQAAELKTALDYWVACLKG